MLVNPRLGDETMMDIFLSGDSAFPSVPAVQLVGTLIEQFPSGFFTAFVSAADTLKIIEKRRQITWPDLRMTSSANGDIVRSAIGRGQLSTAW
jgi:hypothetical protein